MNMLVFFWVFMMDMVLRPKSLLRTMVEWGG